MKPLQLLKKYWYFVLAAFVVVVIFFVWLKRKISFSSPVLDIETTDFNNTTVSFTQDVAKNLASQLYIAIDRVGTDEKAINLVFDKIGGNVTRLKQVYNAFGVPYYSSALGIMQSPIFATVFGLGTAKRNLRDILKYELSANDFIKWNNLFLLAGIA